MKTINNFLKIRNPETGDFEALPGVVSGSGEVNTGVAYSTSEVKTNDTWIDGKPIYTKVFAIPCTAAKTNFSASVNNIGYDRMWIDMANTFCAHPYQYSYTIPYINGSGNRMTYASISHKTKEILVGTDILDAGTTATYYVTVRYTKTSD